MEDREVSGGIEDPHDYNQIMLDWDFSRGVDLRRRILIGKLMTEKTLNGNIIKIMICKGWNIVKRLLIMEVS